MGSQRCRGPRRPLPQTACPFPQTACPFSQTAGLLRKPGNTGRGANAPPVSDENEPDLCKHEPRPSADGGRRPNGTGARRTRPRCLQPRCPLTPPRAHAQLQKPSQFRKGVLTVLKKINVEGAYFPNLRLAAPAARANLPPPHCGRGSGPPRRRPRTSLGDIRLRLTPPSAEEPPLPFPVCC